MKTSYFTGLLALAISLPVKAGSVQTINKDVNNDGKIESFYLAPEKKGQTLYMKTSDGEPKAISLSGILPKTYKLYDLKAKNCIRVGAPNSDDLFDFCYVNGEFSVKDGLSY